MKRREFIALLGGAAAPATRAARARAQQRPGENPSHRHHRRRADLEPFRRAARDRLCRRPTIDYRLCRRPTAIRARTREAAADLARLPVGRDHRTYGTPASRAAKARHPTIPIVIVSVGDPVRRRPGRHTGPAGRQHHRATTFEPSIAGKRLSMVKEMAPADQARPRFCRNPGRAVLWLLPRAAQGACGLAWNRARATRGRERQHEIRQAISAMASTPDGALIVVPDVFVVTHSDLIIALAAQHRLPGCLCVRLHGAGRRADVVRHGSRRRDASSRLLRRPHPAWRSSRPIFPCRHRPSSKHSSI